MADPYGIDPAARRAYRKHERGTGLHGPALHHAMQAWNQQQGQAAEERARQDEQKYFGVDPNNPLAPGNARRFMHGLRRGNLGEGLPNRRQLTLMRYLAQPYRPEQDALSKELSTALNEGAPVPGLTTSGDPTQNLAAENALLGQVEDYTSKNLGVGLTPDQKAAYRASMRAPFEQQYSQAVKATGAAEANAGIDPRSGFGGAQSMELARMREQGLSGIEQKITEEDIGQRNVNEQFAMEGAGAVERGREYDTNARLRRLAEVEGGMAGLAGMGEQEREYDFGLLTSADQAKLSRDMWAKYAKSLEPSTLEQVAGGLSGFFHGLGQ